MRKHDVSQLPVLKEKAIVGSIKESTIIYRITRGGNVQKVFFSTVYNIMDPPFITINPSTEIDEIMSIISSGHSAVLVTDNGGVVGIITKIDVLSSTIRLD
jgi:predicted transcriptional regulator